MNISKAKLLLLCIGLEVALNAHSQSFLTSGLVAYYPFNGNASDESGNGNNATANGTTLSNDRFGAVNRAYSFDGTDDFLSAPASATLNLATNATFSFWMYWNGDNSQLANAGSQTMIDKSITTATPPYQATINYRIAIDQTGGVNPNKIAVLSGQEVYASSSISKLQWHHVAVVFSNGLASIFLNGALDTTAPLNLTNAAIGNLLIGMDSTPASLSIRTFYGLLDDIRIYNRALSSAEVSSLYDYEHGVHIALVKAVKPTFANLFLGTNYQLQVSSNLNTWTNYGSAFTATNSTMDYTHYFDVGDWNQLFFRLLTP